MRPTSGATPAGRASAGERDRPLGRRLGHADVGRHDQRHRHAEHDGPDRVPHTGRPHERHGGIRHEHVLQHDRVRAGAAHAHRVPRLLDAHALGAERHRAVDHLRAVGRVVPADAGDDDVAGRGAARRRFAGRDPVSPVDLGRRAVRVHPVGRSGRDQLRAGSRPPSPAPVPAGRGGAATPAPPRGASASRRSATSPGTRAPAPPAARRSRRRCAAAAELGRHQHRHAAVLAQQREAVGDEGVGAVVLGGVLARAARRAIGPWRSTGCRRSPRSSACRHGRCVDGVVRSLRRPRLGDRHGSSPVSGGPEGGLGRRCRRYGRCDSPTSPRNGPAVGKCTRSSTGRGRKVTGRLRPRPQGARRWTTTSRDTASSARSPGRSRCWVNGGRC